MLDYNDNIYNHQKFDIEGYEKVTAYNLSDEEKQKVLLDEISKKHIQI
jgi:hypothetical protein